MQGQINNKASFVRCSWALKRRTVHNGLCLTNTALTIWVLLTKLCGTHLFLECPDDFCTSVSFLQFKKLFAILRHYPLQHNLGLQLLAQPRGTWCPADRQPRCNKLRLPLAGIYLLGVHPSVCKTTKKGRICSFFTILQTPYDAYYKFVSTLDCRPTKSLCRLYVGC